MPPKTTNAKPGKAETVKKKVKKNVPNGIVYIQASFNNTITEMLSLGLLQVLQGSKVPEKELRSLLSLLQKQLVKKLWTPA
jgi:hypothetical protein